MFIFLLCVYFFSGSQSTVAFPVLSASSTFQDIYARNTTILASLDQTTCTCPDLRTIWDIVWSCLATLFACTWVSVHPNIPGPKKKDWEVTLHRVELMVWTLVLPELVICWALRQWAGARLIEKEQKDAGWTMTHGHFIQMGGFMLYDRDNNALATLSYSRYKELLSESRISVPVITQKEIQDRSKTDGFAKVIVLGQTGWFFAQCIARWIGRIEVTGLEIGTLAFAVINGCIYFCWWHKPFDVRSPVAITLLQPETEKGESICVEAEQSDTRGSKDGENAHSHVDTVAIVTDTAVPQPDPNTQVVDGKNESGFENISSSHQDSTPPYNKELEIPHTPADPQELHIAGIQTKELIYPDTLHDDPAALVLPDYAVPQPASENTEVADAKKEPGLENITLSQQNGNTALPYNKKLEVPDISAEPQTLHLAGRQTRESSFPDTGSHGDTAVIQDNAGTQLDSEKGIVEDHKESSSHPNKMLEVPERTAETQELNLDDRPAKKPSDSYSHPYLQKGDSLNEDVVYGPPTQTEFLKKNLKDGTWLNIYAPDKKSGIDGTATRFRDLSLWAKLILSPMIAIWIVTGKIFALCGLDSTAQFPIIYNARLPPPLGEFGPMKVSPFHAHFIDAPGSGNYYYVPLLPIASAFGAVHCVGWFIAFPTDAEKWIWRISSVFIACTPLLLSMFLILVGARDTVFGISPRIFSVVVGSIITCGTSAYIVFRIFLLILIFTTLRGLPAGAYDVVDWTTFIPHI